MSVIRNLALAQALALAFTFTIGSGCAFAQNAKDEPTAEDLKNSRERNVILLPRPGGTAGFGDKVNSGEGTKSASVNKSGSASKSAKANKSASDDKSASAGNASKHNMRNVSSTAHKTPGKSTIEVSSTNKTPAPQAQAKTVKSNSTPIARTHHAEGPIVQASNEESIINVWLDKKGAAPQYKNGDKMKINVSATQDCNVMIFDFDGHGKLTQLYPNEYQQKTLLRAGDTITFGGNDSPFDYQVSLPKGSAKAQERIFVYAYPVSEKPLSVALNSESGSPFRSGEMTLYQYRKMVAESKVFFNGSKVGAQTSGERDVKIVPKVGASTLSLKLVSNEEENCEQPNKKEVSFTILGH